MAFTFYSLFGILYLIESFLFLICPNKEYGIEFNFYSLFPIPYLIKSFLFLICPE